MDIHLHLEKNYHRAHNKVHDDGFLAHKQEASPE